MNEPRHCDEYIDDPEAPAVGITKNLNAETGYSTRVAVAELSNFSDTP